MGLSNVGVPHQCAQSLLTLQRFDQKALTIDVQGFGSNLQQIPCDQKYPEREHEHAITVITLEGATNHLHTESSPTRFCKKGIMGWLTYTSEDHLAVYEPSNAYWCMKRTMSRLCALGWIGCMLQRKGRYIPISGSRLHVVPHCLHANGERRDPSKDNEHGSSSAEKAYVKTIELASFGACCHACTPRWRTTSFPAANLCG